MRRERRVRSPPLSNASGVFLAKIEKQDDWARRLDTDSAGFLRLDDSGELPGDRSAKRDHLAGHARLAH